MEAASRAPREPLGESDSPGMQSAQKSAPEVGSVGRCVAEPLLPLGDGPDSDIAPLLLDEPLPAGTRVPSARIWMEAATLLLPLFEDLQSSGTHGQSARFQAGREGRQLASCRRPMTIWKALLPSLELLTDEPPAPPVEAKAPEAPKPEEAETGGGEDCRRRPNRRPQNLRRRRPPSRRVRRNLRRSQWRRRGHQRRSLFRRRRLQERRPPLRNTREAAGIAAAVGCRKRPKAKVSESKAPGPIASEPKAAAPGTA